MGGQGPSGAAIFMNSSLSWHTHKSANFEPFCSWVFLDLTHINRVISKKTTFFDNFRILIQFLR